MKKYQLLIVEDDKELAQLTHDFLQQFEFDCHVEHNGLAAVQRIIESQPDLVLLDLMLPDLDGLQICQQIKGQYQGKIMMLTARTDTIDQVLGLEIGADDYIAKPVEPRLLLAKARAVLRREVVVSETTTKNQEVLAFGNVELHKHRREVYKQGNMVEMSNPEYDLFELLAEHQGQIISRDQIFKHLRGVEYDGQSRQVDIHISYLRGKLEDDPGNPTLIKTVRSKGYLFMG